MWVIKTESQNFKITIAKILSSFHGRHFDLLCFRDSDFPCGISDQFSRNIVTWHEYNIAVLLVWIIGSLTRAKKQKPKISSISQPEEDKVRPVFASCTVVADPAFTRLNCRLLVISTMNDPFRMSTVSFPSRLPYPWEDQYRRVGMDLSGIL